jgi:hypothetical protein
MINIPVMIGRVSRVIWHDSRLRGETGCPSSDYRRFPQKRWMRRHASSTSVVLVA